MLLQFILFIDFVFHVAVIYFIYWCCVYVEGEDKDLEFAVEDKRQDETHLGQ